MGRARVTDSRSAGIPAQNAALPQLRPPRCRGAGRPAGAGPLASSATRSGATGGRFARARIGCGRSRTACAAPSSWWPCSARMRCGGRSIRHSPDDLDSVCLDELTFARFACKMPIVPVMAVPCEPPFVIFRLDYVDLHQWLHSDDKYRAGLHRLLEAIEAGLRGEVRYRTLGRPAPPVGLRRFPATRSAGTSAAGSGCSRRSSLAREHRTAAGAADHRRPRHRQVGDRGRAGPPQPRRPGAGLPLLPGHDAARRSAPAGSSAAWRP